MADGTDKDNGDYLGYGVYADTLWSRVEAALSKDQDDPTKLGDDPLVVGIFGEWGAGKSKLLSLILERAQRQRNERIAAHKRDDGFSLTVPVFFQPWKYEHEKHLLVPLLLHIEAELSRCLTLAESTSDRAKGKAVAVAEAVKAHVPAVVEGFKTLWGAARTAYQLAEPASAGVLLPLAEWLAGRLAPDGSGQEKGASPHMAKFRWDAEGGRSYYELHEVLRAVTRPTPDGFKRYLPGAKVDSSFRINFVIFIDDLDRCLPEKAVETLELIKTVFNLESFAFVLALDEEVVERGIGHRYKDYALQNKKPEMPITGFEYLEKIVHLPFRLPGLSNQQAKAFLWRYEQEEVAPGRPERWWLAPRPRPSGDNQGNTEDATSLRDVPPLGAEADLSSLVLRAFNGYVPRKLVRLVELLHQVQEVALRRGRSLTVGGKSGTDVRVVTALVMIQLFQPDLYRLMRRKLQAFPLLLAAFATRSNGYQDLSDPNVSDVDLWLWVVDESAGGDNEWVRSCELATMIDGVVARIASKFHAETDRDGNPLLVDRSDQLSTREQRWRSQSVKLPLVTQLVEHRAAQRHVFDPLRLMHALAGALERGWSIKDSNDVSPAAQLNIEPYFSLLVPVEDPLWNLYFGGGGHSSSPTAPDNTVSVPGASVLQAGIATVSLSTAGSGLVSQPVRFPDRLFADLVSEQTEVQANLVANNELEPGKVMETAAALALLQKLQEWEETREGPEATELLARGLRVIAPLVPRKLGMAYLALVDDPAAPPWQTDAGQGFPSKEVLDQAVKRSEYWTALGQDERFEPERFYLPRQRLASNERNTEREPIPGFVRVFENKQEVFRPFKGPSVTLKPYYMARYLTTVDQYAHFVAANGYGEPAGEKPDWWDTLGWAWRIGRWDSQVKEKTYHEHLTRRIPELRGAPMKWAEQQAHGSRPVMRINWFEARAYANWLTIQLRAELDAALRQPSYAVRLPTEAQWERAARAKNRTQADERQYPWGDADKNTAHLHANIGASDIGRPSPVGLFAPNPLGLCDLSGNLWEWQSNLYQPGGEGQDKGLNTDVTTLKTHEELNQCDLPALRGGAWSFAADFARASFRDRIRPDGGDFDVGFRVVLSLAE